MIRPGELLDFYNDEQEVKCRVERVSKDEKFFSVIAEANTLRIGKPFGMSITRPNGIEKGEGIVVKVRHYTDEDGEKAINQNNLEYLIKVTKPLKRMQKRNYFRYECYIPATVSELDDPKLHKAHILDISAGGIKLYANYRFLTNKIINIITKLGDKNKHFLGIVLSVDEMDNLSREYKYAVRVKFTEMSQKDEDSIAGFIFSEYRKAAHKRAKKE